MTTLVLSAEVTDVNIGFLVIDGLMDENGNFYIAVPQMADIDLVPPNRSSKQLEAFINTGFQSHVKLDFVKLKTEFNPKPINAISLKTFEVLLARLDRKGNVKAQEFRDVLAGLSLHQLFCDAFGIRFEKEERQSWLKARMLTKETFWFMGDSIKQYYLEHPRQEKYPSQNYCEAFDTLNFALFGKRSKTIKEILGIGKSALNRDHFGQNSLKKIEMIQRIAEAQIKYESKKPVEAVKFAAAVMNYQVSDFRE
ncbi:hypothetical protein Cri9333_5000 (plasmid) [Crinalium epipsammum PCC 9333]|uniref:Uncharacterized protein n=1 Tax=Crinalium epipsammum PCC 9333 TaxID=1173022 RepID=K9W8E4_9CYAN|nr:hypothetical protein [Crinalium epipsammum]AFZ15755.1 hypothetical protein Cri9333_5000 [Crinalium epipsammum PCC 9333]